MSNIDMMQAGREMDALVAERVMGLKVFYQDDKTFPLYIPGNKPIKTHQSAAKTVPHYSTDIAAGWEVVQAIASNTIDMSQHLFAEYLETEIGGRFYDLRMILELKPVYICRAALKAVE